MDRRYAAYDIATLVAGGLNALAFVAWGHPFSAFVAGAAIGSSAAFLFNDWLR